MVVVAISVALAACGDGGRGQSRAQAAASEMIGGGCSSSESGSSNGQTHTMPTTCAVVFENGEQFSCPEGVKARTPAGVAATSGCRQIAPVRFPAAWKVVLHEIASVRDCLRRRGDHVSENVVTSGLPGGSPNGIQSGNPRLVGELVVGGRAPAFIGFTLHPPFSGATKPPGWHVRYHANVAVISQNPGAVSGCAFTAVCGTALLGQNMPITRAFLLEPTPGLEPGTPSLRVKSEASGCLRLVHLSPAQRPILPRQAAPHLRLSPDVPLPTHCPRRHPPASSRSRRRAAACGCRSWRMHVMPTRLRDALRAHPASSRTLPCVWRKVRGPRRASREQPPARSTRRTIRSA
jgi:hypothetical protein